MDTYILVRSYESTVCALASKLRKSRVVEVKPRRGARTSGSCMIDNGRYQLVFLLTKEQSGCDSTSFEKLM